jgi:pimeloyl-ACP methyl ester carboxylesterase
VAEKKINVPFILRFIPWIFPKLERIVPLLAYKFAVKLFFTPIRYKIPSTEKEFTKTGEPFLIEVNRKKIRGFSWGEGNTIVGVHGWSGRGAMLRKFVKPLTVSGFRVVLFDGPAHGSSEGFSTDPLEFEGVILEIESKFNPVVGYITHSFGGTAALFCFSRGLKPKPIVLIAVPAIGEDVVQTFTARINGTRKVIKKLEEFTQQWYGKSFYEISAINTARTIGFTPALVIHDKNDDDVPVEHGEKLMDALPNGTLLRTIGLGHNRILRDPSVVNHVVEFFAHHCSLITH